MLIHATKEEMRFVESELLHFQQTDRNLEVQIIPDDEDSKMTLGFEATTLLHLAAKYGNAKATQYLVDNGCNVNVTNPSGCTPLIVAIHFDERKVVQMLLDANADIFLPNRSGVSAAKLALQKPKNFANMIVKKVKSICREDSEATGKKLLELGCSLGIAAYLRDTSILNYMLDNGRAVDERDPHNPKCTALHHAVRMVDVKIVNLLLDRGIDVNVKDRHGKTALFYYDTESTDTSEKLEVLKTVLDRGDNLTMPDKKGVMPVEFLLEKGQIDTVRILLKYIVDMHRKNQEGVPLFHLLIANTKPGVTEVLRNQNWNYCLLDNRGRSALWAAVQSGSTKSLEFLLAGGLDADNEDKLLYTVLLWLAAFPSKVNSKNRLRCVELLLIYGANEHHMRYNSRVDRIDTILDYCLDHNDFDLAKLILAHVAMTEEFGRPIPEFGISLNKISSDIRFQKYFRQCKRWLEKMKKIVIFDKLRLIDLFMEDEGNHPIFARNAKLVAQLERVWYNQRRSHMYYCNILRRIIEAIVKRVKLKNLVVLFVSENCALSNNDYLIEKIVEFMY